MFQSIQLAKGVTLHIRPTSQFKTVNFSIKWSAPLTVEAASVRSVLSNVLQHSNEKFKKTSEFRSYLDDLFGTVLYLDSTKRGNDHIVLLNIETVNDQYLSTQVLDDVIEVLHTVIFKPNLENGLFVPSIVEREKQIVIERIESIFDDKTRYAQQRISQIIRPNHPASISSNGTIDSVKTITPEALKKAYESMINEDVVDIYVVGDVDIESITNKLTNALPFKDREVKTISKVENVKAEKEYTKEVQEMKQGKLHIGFSTPVYFESEDFPKMQVFNGIFGGYAHSKLFMNVRERESLAYYAASSFSSHYGLLFVFSGIEPSNEKKATEVIFEQLEAIKKGEISDLELVQTKAMLTNNLKETLDSARGQIEIFDQYKKLSEDFSVENWRKKWESVTKEDVQKMAQQLQHEATYFLCGKEA